MQVGEVLPDDAPAAVATPCVPRLLVSRMLGRVMARPELCCALEWHGCPGRAPGQSGSPRALPPVAGLATSAVAAGDASASSVEKVASRAAGSDSASAIAARGRAGCCNGREGFGDTALSPLKRTGDSEVPPQIRVLASEVSRRLLLGALVTAAGVNASVTIAHFLLVQLYKRLARLKFGEEELLISLVLRLCSPTDWARCASCSRGFRAAGMTKPGLMEYWFSGHSVEGRKDALKTAIQHNVISLLRPLAAAGGNVNCVFEQFWFRTPLHRAASRGHKEFCQLLLDLRADAALPDHYGAAPIHLVASKGRVPIVRLLLRHDPRIANAVDHSGRTPCHMAALKGHLDVVKQLVFARANAAAEAHDGRTPLHMAQRVQSLEIVQFLERWQLRQQHADEDLPAARYVVGALIRRAAESSTRERGAGAERSDRLPQIGSRVWRM